MAGMAHMHHDARMHFKIPADSFNSLAIIFGIK